MLKKGNMGYRQRIILSMAGLILVVVFVFIAWLYVESVKEEEDQTRSTLAVSAAQAGYSIDEKLSLVKNYYLVAVTGDEMRWSMENTMSYSDYENISSLWSQLIGNATVSDYISGFSYINRRSGFILSNKGMYACGLLENAGAVEALTGTENKRNYWNYSSESNLDALDDGWRHSIDVGGLLLVMHIGSVNSEQYGSLLVNVNLGSLLASSYQGGEGECLTILDGDGEIVYASDPEVAAGIQTRIRGGTFGETGSDRIRVDGVTWLVEECSLDILDWTCYTASAWNTLNQSAMRLLVLTAATLLLAAVCLLIVRILYRPISSLTEHVMGVGSGAENAADSYAIGDQELKAIAGRVETLLDSNRTLEEVLEEQKEPVLELFALRLLRGDILEVDRGQYLAKLRLHGEGCFAVMSAVVRFREEAKHQETEEETVCKKLIRSLPVPVRSRLLFPPVHMTGVVVCMVEDETQSRLLERVMDVYTDLQKYVSDVFGLNISLGVSSTFNELFDAPEGLRQSIRALKQNADHPQENGVYGEFSNCGFFQDEAETRWIDRREREDFEKSMKNAIRSCSKEEAYRVMDGFIRWLENQRMCQGESTIYLLQLTNTVIMTALESELSAEELFSGKVSVIYQQIVRFYDYEKVRRYIKREVIDPVLFALSARWSVRAGTIMGELGRLLDERKGNITLSECAEALNYHPTYIWKVLKEETGKSFSDFLADYKIERAKTLLSQTDKTVAEIAEELNYSNAQNFIRFFSKTVGLTPGKYRMSVRQGDGRVFTPG